MVTCFQFGLLTVLLLNGTRVDTDSLDTVCGPRCVEFLCRYYKTGDVPLMEIVHEMQSPDITRGSSLADIQSALRKRRIFSEGLGAKEICVETLTYPMIAAFSTDDGEKRIDNPMLHFAIVLPYSSGEEVSIWDGYHGLETISRKEFGQRRTVGFLFTSRDAETMKRQIYSYQMQGKSSFRLGSLLCFQLGLIGIWCARETGCFGFMSTKKGVP